MALRNLIGIKVSGIPKTQKALRRLGDRGKRALTSGLVRKAEEIIGEAKGIVPVRDGILRDSGFVDDPTTVFGGPSVELGFGGPAAQYALVQHEGNFRHNPPGQKKYLEIPFNIAQATLDDFLAAHIKREMRL